MISKQEIMALAAELQLQAHVVEKDYALDWFLAGISAHPVIGPRWVFKGGTCLKKCYFETYRFSEDLDFTLQDAEHLDEAFLAEVFDEIGEWAYAACGLQLPPEAPKFEVFTNLRGTQSAQGRVGVGYQRCYKLVSSMSTIEQALERSRGNFEDFLRLVRASSGA